MQSRYYNPAIGRFINADALVSTGQGVLGNNMFAYCNNNPVILADASGTVSTVCITADGAIDDSPWREISPSGGGHSYYVIIKNDYSGDLFYTQIALRYIGYGLKRLYDAYSQEYLRQQEMEHQQLLAQHKAIENAYSYLNSDEFLASDAGIVTKSTVNSALIGAGFALIKTMPAALAVLPVSPGITLTMLGTAAATGFVEGAITGFAGGLLEIL